MCAPYLTDRQPRKRADTLVRPYDSLYRLIKPTNQNLLQLFRREICQSRILRNAQPLTANAGIQTGCFYE